MGEKQNQPVQLSFNPSLKVDFQGSRVTSDSGLLLVRELDERLDLSALIAENQIVNLAQVFLVGGRADVHFRERASLEQSSWMSNLSKRSLSAGSLPG